MSLEVLGGQSHAPVRRGLRNIRTSWISLREGNRIAVGVSLDVLADRRLEVHDVIGAVQGVRDQLKVVRVHYPICRADVCFARGPRQSEKDAFVPLAVESAGSRLLSQQYPNHMLSNIQPTS